MTDDEQDRQIAADVRARRDLDRKLACLEGKRSKMRAGIQMMLRQFDRGPVSDDASRAIDFPTREEALGLLQEIDNTQRDLAEVNRRLDRY